jgi:hypothetical protein
MLQNLMKVALQTNLDAIFNGVIKLVTIFVVKPTTL